MHAGMVLFLQFVHYFRWLYGESCDVREKLEHIYHALLEGKESNFEGDKQYSSSPIAAVKNFYHSLR